MKLKPYLQYKDSGVSWLGEIPESWSIMRTKYLLREIDDRTQTGTETLLSMRQIRGLVPHHEVSSKPTNSSDLVGYKRTYPNDIVVNRMRASIGLIARTQVFGLVSPDYAVFRPSKDINTDYFTLLFKTPIMGARFRIESKGLGTGTSGFLRLYSERFGAIAIPLPSRSEQDKLLAFIQFQDLQIRRFIRNKRLLIKLLNEQKQVIINQAVTRGIDPNVSLKPSSTVFLEKIPVMWEVLPIKRILNRLIDTEHKTAPSIEGGRYLVVRTTNIKNGKLVLKNAYFTDEYGFREWTRRGIPKPGELLFTREAPAGEACIVPDNIDLCMGQRVVLMGINPDKCLSKFALLSIYGGLTSEFIKVKSQGSTVPHFNMSDISAMPILIPLVSEQKEIIESVEIEIKNIENAQERVQREIELIQEYRTRLISDVVTGKIDVRDIEIPALPDEDVVEDLEDEELLDAAEAELEAVEEADE